eukprot:scaffold13057_cov22-Tisochrysis_lutea.AAC.1
MVRSLVLENIFAHICEQQRFCTEHLCACLMLLSVLLVPAWVQGALLGAGVQGAPPGGATSCCLLLHVAQCSAGGGKGIKVHFLEVLHALAGHVAGAELPAEEERRVHCRICKALPQ